MAGYPQRPMPFRSSESAQPARDRERPNLHQMNSDATKASTRSFTKSAGSRLNSDYAPQPQSLPAEYPDEYVNNGNGGPQKGSGSTGPSGSSGMSAFIDGVRRKKSLVRPERERLDPNHRHFYYREHAAALPNGQMSGRHEYASSAQGRGNMNNSHGTASVPYIGNESQTYLKPVVSRKSDYTADPVATGAGVGPSFFKRHQLMKKRQASAALGGAPGSNGLLHDDDALKSEYQSPESYNYRPPVSPWYVYCRILTCCCPNFTLSMCGIKLPESQKAWREKMGLLGIIGALMAAVGYLTFGFTQSVCGKPPLRYAAYTIDQGSLVIHGYDYAFDNYKHPAALGLPTNSNPLYPPVNAGSMDASFLFQKVNENCKGLLTALPNSGIPQDTQGNVGWYMPCNLYNQFGTTQPNFTTPYYNGYACHTNSSARDAFYAVQPQGQVYYTWDQVNNDTRNLGVYGQNVLDFGLLNWINTSQISYPAIFNDLKGGANETYRGRDITMHFYRSDLKGVGNCLTDIIRIGFIDTDTIGCVASDVVLYVSLVFIIGVVVIKFGMAVFFGWFLSWRLGNFGSETYEQRMKRARDVENWTNDIYRRAPEEFRPDVTGKAQTRAQKKKSYLPHTSRFTAQRVGPNGKSGFDYRRSTMAYTPRSSNFQKSQSINDISGAHSTIGAPESPMLKAQRSSVSLSLNGKGGDGTSRRNSSDESASSRRYSMSEGVMGSCPFPLDNVVPQPPPGYEPFNYPLAHTILLVTAYSESEEGLRTTLDSLATTDYPNSHKLILVICDGVVKGSSNSKATPDIVLDMMSELVVPAKDVEAQSLIAIADGTKRHNMAKVYAGFYKYNDNTMEKSVQQRVPMVMIAKVGTPEEATETKPGNRGKRDSQIVLMSFLQKVMFDERMTPLEYEFFNSMWRVTGISPDHYEIVLMVDADTKIFPDSVTRMVSCMVKDHQIMGLCGETKIANKKETWVTMIQVFEYYVSHHLTKAFESMFGGVTCLPGCFCMYRIKAPKGPNGYWVPILANPDIVEHYSENVVDTLHKKNLLLLGEDRYLTTLMLKTFPKRKMMFVPQAVCKTVVPDTFSVLLSQRRRWINSTVHNLCELLLVRDLCGTFCFSMQFVVFMELVGTLVLPAAISFTLYLLIITTFETPKPVISLILLAFVLGLPGLLIVVTSRRVAYLGWMLVYLASLPIWNFILPAYAYWHFDDFSWGATRKVYGERGGGHGAAAGELDEGFQIPMKRWAEFERERRNRSGTQSRDTYDLIRRTGSPVRSDSNRMSVVSSEESNLSGSNSAMQLSNDAKPSIRGATQAPLLSKTNDHGNFYHPASSPLDPKASGGINLFSHDKNHGGTEAVPLLDMGSASTALNKSIRSGSSRTALSEVPHDRDSSASSSSHSGHQSSGQQTLASRSTSSGDTSSLPPYRIVDDHLSANRRGPSNSAVPRRAPGGPRGPRPSS